MLQVILRHQNDESHLVWEAISSLKLLRAYSLKLLNFIITALLRFLLPEIWHQSLLLKASSALGYLCSLYNIPDRLVSWSPKLISLAIIKETEQDSELCPFQSAHAFNYRLYVRHADNNKSKQVENKTRQWNLRLVKKTLWRTS